MSFKNYFYINSDYGYNKNDFKLIENFENISSKNCMKENTQLNYIENKKKADKNNINTNINKNKKNYKKNNEVNTFPLAWTCYQNNGKWICPMRGDK